MKFKNKLHVFYHVLNAEPMHKQPRSTHLKHLLLTHQQHVIRSHCEGALGSIICRTVIYYLLDVLLEVISGLILPRANPLQVEIKK